MDINAIKILFVVLISTTICFSRDYIHLSNNLKTNINILANQVEFLIQTNTSKKEKYISDLFKLYYNNYDKIAAIELKNETKTIYSSYRQDNTMIFFKDKTLDLFFDKTKEFYKKDINNLQGKEIATLIVYFKNTINFSKQELKYLKDKKVLRVQNNANLLPYNSNKNGVPTGYAIDYLGLIANELALEVEFIQGKWDNFMNMLENKELDIMINVLKSKQSEERFLFSNKPFATSPPSMLTKIDHKDINNKFEFYFAYNKDNLILKNIIQKVENILPKKDIEKLNKKWLKKIKQEQEEKEHPLFTKKEIDYLNKKNIITMCIDPNSAPFEFITRKGNYSGIIASFMEEILKNSGVKFEVLGKESWSSSLNAVKNKVCDILPFSAETKERTKYLNFTKSYFTFSNVIATRSSEIFINSLDSIKDKKIAIIKDYATKELIQRKYPNIKIIEVKNTLEGLKKVSKGEVFALVDLFPTVAQTLQKNNIPNVKITGKTSIDIEAKIAIRNDELILQSILNKAINSIKEEDKE